MAEIVSLSQCAMGIGPCCLKMSARALNGRRQHSEVPWAGVQATKASDAFSEAGGDEPGHSTHSHCFLWGWAQRECRLELAMLGN